VALQKRRQGIFCHIFCKAVAQSILPSILKGKNVYHLKAQEHKKEFARHSQRVRTPHEQHSRHSAAERRLTEDGSPHRSLHRQSLILTLIEGRVACHAVAL
jgi:hypothetical protein